MVVAGDLARRALARLDGPPDVVVVIATRPWKDELGVLRRALRAALPATCCSLATTASSKSEFAVGLLALRLARPCADFGAAAVEFRVERPRRASRERRQPGAV